MNARSSNAGFSLVEVMCAVLILGIALSGLALGVSTALRSSKDAEVQTTAALIAAGQLEFYRADGIIEVGEEEGDVDDGSLYRWKQTTSNAGIDGLYEVAVVVEDTRSGKSLYELRTLIFDQPIESTQDDSQTRRQSQRAEGRRP